MAAGNAMQTVLVIGVIGVGGYLAYEYSQYSSAMNTIAQIQVGGVTLSQLESILPFFTWLSFNWGGSGGGTAQQQSLYAGMQAALAGTLTASTQAPGTTSAGQATTVSTIPPTTTTVTASSSPSVSPLTPARTYAPAGSGLAPLAGSRLPLGTRIIMPTRTTTITPKAGAKK